MPEPLKLRLLPDRWYYRIFAFAVLTVIAAGLLYGGRGMALAVGWWLFGAPLVWAASLVAVSLLMIGVALLYWLADLVYQQFHRPEPVDHPKPF